MGYGEWLIDPRALFYLADAGRAAAIVLLWIFWSLPGARDLRVSPRS
jgi:hypothetical protein